LYRVRTSRRIEDVAAVHGDSWQYLYRCTLYLCTLYGVSGARL